MSNIVSENDPLSGDPVMVSTGIVGLEAFNIGILKRSILIFDKVKCFTYINHTINAFDENNDLFINNIELTMVQLFN